MRWLLLTLAFCTGLKAHSPYLEGRIPPFNHRYHTYCEVLRLCEERGVKTIVETGTSRCGETNYLLDGGSTNIFAHFCRNRGGILYSVDIDKTSLWGAAQGLHFNFSNVKLIQSDSVLFLKHFDRPIDFLYLDSYDFDQNNPKPSQLHHLKEIEAAYPHLHKKSIIMIDDCDLPHGGKGKLVLEFLLERGWKIHMKSYQVILLRC